MTYIFTDTEATERQWPNDCVRKSDCVLSFVYSLLESCKLNDIPFGEYIEDICTRIMHGDEDYESMLPCDYRPSKVADETQAVV